MKDNTKLIVMAAGAAAAYWYVTNYGPNGAAFNAAGQQIAATWWQTWFSGTTAVASTPVTSVVTAPVTTGQTAAATTNTTATTSPATSTSTAPTGVPVYTYTSNDPVGPTYTATQKILMASGATDTTMLNLDQWNYYYNQLYTPVTPNQMAALVSASPVGDQPMTIATYLAAIQQAGINSGLSGVGDYSVLPAMMSFRRGTTGSRMRGMKDYKSGGVTIQ